MTAIIAAAQATAEQMAAYLLSKNPEPKIHMPVKDFCQLYITEAAKEGVRGDALFAQSCWETNDFKFTGTVTPEQNNYAGLGTLNADTKGAYFPNEATGILAHAQHAKGYATIEELNQECVDPRYHLLVKYGKAGTASYWEELGGKWAVPGYDTKKYASLEEANDAHDSYGYKIINILNAILQMEVTEQEETTVKKTQQYQTKNGAYTCGRTINVKGAMIHSYGCPQPNPNVLAKSWNNPSTKACVHEHIGKDEVIVTLPCMETKGTARRGWHAGGAANNTHLSAEMTEPATIKYTSGSNWIELADGSNTKAHVLATYKNAVEEFAQFCTFHGLDPLKDGVILSHKEGHARGIASNHGDVEHIWRKFGLTMDKFRKDIKAAMVGNGVDFGGNVTVTDTSAQKVNPLSGKVTVIYTGEDGLNIRLAPSYNAAVQQVVYNGVYTVVGISADEKWYKLKSGGFITTIPSYVTFKATEEQKQSTAGTGYYRVRKAWNQPDTQIGAFKDKNNAVDICKHNSGYKVFDNDGKEVYPCMPETNQLLKIKVTVADLRIRKGPGTTYDYHKKNGKPLYTNTGIFTIVRTEEGPGAKMWGLLKSYEDNENGWISLDDEYVDVL